MTAVFFFMRFDVAPIVIWIFEFPLDQEIRAVSVIRIWSRLGTWLGSSRHRRRQKWIVVGVKVHDSPQLDSRFKKAYCDPG
jgi:hypothetical protein